MAVKILLHSKEEEVCDLPRYDDLMMHRVILAPLLQNGRFSLSIPIHVALQAGQIAVAGEIVQLSSSRPSCGVIDWHDLEVVHMESNWFDLPGSTHLLYIGLSSNRLRLLPERVLQFKSLQKLQIHHNCIITLPAELFNMPNLKVLDASFNKIVSLPDMLRYPLTSSLENVNLAHNKLTDLPDYFINSKIIVLDLNSNRLSKVPDCVPQLHQMNTLCLDFNVGIEFIPYELGNLRNLTILGLKGLPYLKNIPPNRKDISPLNFLKSRARSPQSFQHYDVAVIINDSYNMCSGTVMNTIQQHSRRKHYSYLAYSDAKQFLYFHKAFSLQSTVHLVVWECEAGQPADDIFPILTHLAMYSPSAQIIIAACWMTAITSTIQSTTRERIANSQWKDLERKGGVTVMVICVDKDALVSRSNSLQYLTEILHRKGEVGEIHLSVPNSYVALQGMLRTHASTMKQEGNAPVVNEQRLWELIKNCRHNDLAGRKELPVLVSYLTDIAAIISLPSNRATDSNIYVLNRQWFLDALSGLLNPNTNMGNPFGLFPVHCLCDLLSCPNLQAQSDLPYAFCLFVSRLGLAITLTSSQVLVPAMLSSVNSETSSDFSAQFEVRRVYTLRQVPESFWGRLIAHLRINMDYLIPMTALDSAGEVVGGIGYLSDTLPTNDLLNWNYWKTGIVVYIGGTTLLFSIEAITPINEPEYREGLEVCVVNTPMGAKAMNMVTATINSLLKNWYKELWQTVNVSVPCPDCVRIGQYTLFPFDACCQVLVNGATVPLYCSDHDQHYSAVKLVPDLLQANGQGQTLFTSADLVQYQVDDKSTCLSQPPSETVFKGQFGAMDVAVKPFPPPVPNGERSTNPFLDFWHEFTLLSYINLSESSPYLIDLMVSTVKPLALVFPLACYFSLDEVIQEKQIIIPPILRVRMLYQLAHALEALHLLKVIHRNVCLANILVFSLSMDSSINVRLGSFSDACIALNQGLAIGEYGTFPAPEMSKYGYQYDERVDVFAYGFTSYEILSRKRLKFRQGVRFQAASTAADRPALNNISKIAPHLATTIEKCWNNDESKRPFFGTILKTFQNPLHTITREGEGVYELQDFNAAAVRFSRNESGTFKGDLYLCSSTYSVKDSASLIHFSLPGLTSNVMPIDLLSRCIICMCCTAQYLWVSFADKYVKVYSTETLAFEKKIDFEHYVTCMAVSPDAVYLGMDNGDVQLYKMSNPSPLHSPYETRRISYQKAIQTIQVLEDCVICCTKRSCIRIHPETLQPEQEFPVVAETEVKHPVLCLDRENGEEYLWVSFRRLQQIVVFNALSGSALYGCNSSEVLGLPKNEVWVTCMLSVLDTVWVGMNTGHVLIFNAFTQQPSLLTYCKIHTEKVDRLMLLQPSYWGVNSPCYYYGDQFGGDSEDSEDTTDDHHGVSASSSLTNEDLIDMPRSMLVLSIGRGIEQQIPKIGRDGLVLNKPTTSTISESTPRIHLLLMEAPDAAGAHKLECQARRSPVPYMENYRCDVSPSISEFPSSSLLHQDSASVHRPLHLNINRDHHHYEESPVNHIDTPDVLKDSLARDFYVVSSNDPPPTDLLRSPSKHGSGNSRIGSNGTFRKFFGKKDHKPNQNGLEGVPRPHPHDYDVYRHDTDSTDDTDDDYQTMSPCPVAVSAEISDLSSSPLPR